MSEYDDSHMLSKVLERMAAQALHLKDKIDSGLEIPSWAEYKIYNAYSGLGSALGTAYPGEYEEKMAAATFSKSMDKHPALKGKQSQLPDKIQAGIIKKKLRMRKHAAASTLGEGLFLLAKRPALAKAYNDLKSTRLQKLLQTEIPGTKGIHLPGLNPQRVESLSSQLSHPETAVQIALPFSYVHMPIAEAAKKRMPGLKDLVKESSSPRFSSDGDRLYHDLGGGVSFSLPEGAEAERYKKQVEKSHGYVGSTAPTSKDDHPSVRAGKALSRRLDKKNPNRPRYRSLKDFVLRRPDPNYRPGAEVHPLKKQAGLNMVLDSAMMASDIGDAARYTADRSRGISPQERRRANMNATLSRVRAKHRARQNLGTYGAHLGSGLEKESAAPHDSRQKRRQDLRDAGIAAGSLGGSAVLAKPSAERLLGVQRYVHGTSDDAAEGILRSGLDPSFGGADHGGSAAIGSDYYVDQSTGKIHVATDNLIGRRLVASPHASLAEAAAEAKKRGVDIELDQAKKSYLRGILPGAGGSIVGGAMPYEEFHSSFEQDPDQIPGHAFRSTRKIDPEDLSQGGAGLGDIFRNRSKNLGRYIKDNPRRFGTGLALGTGSLVLAGVGAKSLKDIYDRREGTKQAAATATKTDPAKWEAAKREAKNKMGGKHSARAMQLATQIYKKKGGGYSGAKPTSKNNSLKKWTKQKWNWSGGDKPGPGGKGVYLPERKADRLKKTESGRKSLAAASRKKSEATRKGEQYSSHGLAKGTSLKVKK